ncbi:DMT family transporter [Candidatus Gottesmanbacteria bacterium]|nr:DMT family transporter [Candidatus Gottesmanbacteria bacterium]
MSNRTKALLAIVAASMLWATAGSAKILVRTFDPFTAAFFRFLVATLIIVPFFLRAQRGKKTSLLPLVPLGLASTGNIAFYYLALRTTTANAAMMIYNATPLVIALTASRMIGEPVTTMKFVGILLGLVGTTLIALLPALEGGGSSLSGDLTGNLFVVGAVASWTIYTIGSRRMLTTKRATPLDLTTASIVTSSSIFGLLAAISWKPTYTTAMVAPTNIALMIHLGIFVTVATYLLYQWAIKHSSATTASLNQYLQPVIALLFNISFLGERLTTGFALGSIVVLAGVVLATGGPLIREIKRWKMLREA